MERFKVQSTLRVGTKEYKIFSLRRLPGGPEALAKLPYSIRVLLENLLRHLDGAAVTGEDVEALLRWDGTKPAEREIMFRPARVLLQDFTGVPAVVDLAAMRDAMKELGADPARINPLCPVDLVIDHSLQVDCAGTAESLERNVALEYGRNAERYAFLRWGQKAFGNFRVVPPGTGIVHQVNMEFLAPVVCARGDEAFFDSLVGTDSHTTMINGLGVLGWGVGGIEAEACMLGQPVSMLVPEVTGVRLLGALPEDVTATDAVLALTRLLRKKGVVGKFVEFFGPGLAALSLADRATLSNMAPEYGATCGFFPVDGRTLEYLALTGRDAAHVELVRAYAQEQGVFYTPQAPAPAYTDTVELDLSGLTRSAAGPKLPHELVRLSDVPAGLASAMEKNFQKKPADPAQGLCDGAVVIASITSCTNTANPGVMIAAGLLAKKAAARGLRPKPWVKTSLCPGSKAVTGYLEKLGLLGELEKTGFYLAGYGCATCIGNSGPLAPEIEKRVREEKLVVVSVLSGNRNFEGRVHALAKANYLMSPPLVVAYAIAGHAGINLETEPLGTDAAGKPVYLKDLWPTRAELEESLRSVTRDLFAAEYADVFTGDKNWQSVPAGAGQTFVWDGKSTYIRKPTYLSGLARRAGGAQDIRGARILAWLGDTVTTDHISPAGSIAKDSPAARYLESLGVAPKDFNAYGARRGNHEVMMRGTFANIRLKNRLADGREGGVTRCFADGQITSIFDAAEKYRETGTPLIVLAGKEYGAGSSRDWAAKGPALLGVRAVLAVSFERIHRSNLVGMGVLPLIYADGREPEWIRGDETVEIRGIAAGLKVKQPIDVEFAGADGTRRTVKAVVRIDTAEEMKYFENGGILPYVLRQLL